MSEDRREALLDGNDVDGWRAGSLLYADVSGFTALTEALARSLGLKRGAEALTAHLNGIYEVLIGAVGRSAGSVIGFSGDAITCWFDGDDGSRALSCARSMQEGMAGVAEVPLPGGGGVRLAIKAVVSGGEAYRCRVGDPSVQLLDVLAGEVVDRVAALEGSVGSGQVLLDPQAFRGGAARHGTPRRTGFSVTAGAPAAGPPPVPEKTHGSVRNWLLPQVYESLESGQGDLLTELRPCAALFLSFTGVDFGVDESAAGKLDRLVRHVQGVASARGGSLLQLTIGEKGSFLYIAFGAPTALEGYCAAAAATALELLRLPRELEFVSGVSIGLAAGTVRAGAYGAASRKTYGALGEATNLAARLMQKAASGQILASEAVRRATHGAVEWRELQLLHLKGVADGVRTFEPLRMLGASRDGRREVQSPFVGREAELEAILSAGSAAARGRGAVIAVWGEVGIGKSRLIGEAAHGMAGGVALAGAAGGSAGRAPYQVFRSIYGELLGVSGGQDHPTDSLARSLAALGEDLLPRLPLLGPVLGLEIPDNELTGSLPSASKRELRESLLVELLGRHARRLAGRGETLVLVVEDLQRADELSLALVDALARAVPGWPLLMLVSSRTRPWSRGDAEPDGALLLELDRLSPSEAARLIEQAVAAHASSERTASRLPSAAQERLQETAGGNPLYLLELLDYLLQHPEVASRLPGPGAATAGMEAEWPEDLQSLVLSRIDGLSPVQRSILKVASVVGNTFRALWLQRFHPALGSREALEAQLQQLHRQRLVSPVEAQADTYRFHHSLARDVAYGAMTYATRASLHERLAVFLESDPAAELGAGDRLWLLAHHYGQSENLPKKRHYLFEAGETARRSWANDAALDWYGRLLPLVAGAERARVLSRLGQVRIQTGDFGVANDLLLEASDLAAREGDLPVETRCRRLLGEVAEKQGRYEDALAWLTGAEAACRSLDADEELLQVLLALGGNVLWQQGAYDQALERLGEAHALAERLGHDQGVSRALHGLGNIALYTGDPARASERFRQSLAIREAAGDRLGVANGLNNLAIVAAGEDDTSTAVDLFERSLAIRREIGDRAGTAVALNNLGYMAAQAGEVGRAKEFYGESLRLRGELGDRLGRAVSLTNLAELVRLEGDDLRALGLLLESLQLTADIGNVREAAAALVGLAGILSGGRTSRPGERGRRRDAEDALLLAAAAQGLLGSIGAVEEAELRGAREQAFAQAAAQLSARRSRELSAAGATLTLGDALALARGAVERTSRLQGVERNPTAAARRVDAAPRRHA